MFCSLQELGHYRIELKCMKHGMRSLTSIFSWAFRLRCLRPFCWYHCRFLCFWPLCSLDFHRAPFGSRRFTSKMGKPNNTLWRWGKSIIETIRHYCSKVKRIFFIIAPRLIAIQLLETLGIISSALSSHNYHFFTRLPFDARLPIGFAASILINTCILFPACKAILAFPAFYVGICFNIRSFIEDISLDIVRFNGKIHRKTPIRATLPQLIQFHVNYHRYIRSQESVVLLLT